MYEIKPQSLKTFIEDTSIKLPRFQRKKSWGPEKNFLLAVSVFKGYPLGVSILNIEKSSNNKLTKWLLDGRQRRTALTEMYNDPEKIYNWAKRYVKFSGTDSVNTVILKFIGKVNDYIELDTSELDTNDADNSQMDIDLIEPISSDSPMIRNSGLQLLVKIISLSHGNNRKSSGLTAPFDFTKFYKNLYYVESDGTLNCKKVKSLMKQYKDYCNDEECDYADKDSFVKFYESRYMYKNETSKISFLQHLELMWNQIYERIELFDKLDERFISSTIGLIEISDITITDSQKIFNIINTGGTMLTAAEILSAKPSWNIPVKNPSQKVLEVTTELYKKLEIPVNSVVRWDLPATLLRRVDDKGIIFGNFNEDSTGFEKQVSLGFKILSGIFQRGVKKEDIAALSTNAVIDWNFDIDNVIDDLNLLFKIINDYSFFKYFRTWQTNIRLLMSDATMLNFILLIYNDWVIKGKPVSDNNAKKVQKNAYILFDRMVYEYVTKQWRGSSDNKIARNIDNFTSLQRDGLFIPIDQEKWNALITNIIDHNVIDNDNIDQTIMTPLVYYFYLLQNIPAPITVECAIEVDHIIPKTKFDSSTIKNKDVVKDNLFNLGLLPKKENISKSNKLLREITDEWLIDQIEIYENIKEEDFLKYSDINNLEALKELRGNLYKKVYNECRKQKINN